MRSGPLSRGPLAESLKKKYPPNNNALEGEKIDVEEQDVPLEALEVLLAGGTSSV